MISYEVIDGFYIIIIFTIGPTILKHKLLMMAKLTPLRFIFSSCFIIGEEASSVSSVVVVLTVTF